MRLVIPRSISIVLATLCAAAAAAQPAPSFPYPMRVERLPNGLQVVLVRTPHPGVIAYNTLVRAGSRNEVEPGRTGFAHLFEHLMFRGSERFPEAARSALEMRLGIDSNAWTSDDMTVYTSVGPASALPSLVELEADRFRSLSASETVFQTEARAVLGEYNKSVAAPAMKLGERLRELAFTRHPYGHTPLGRLEDIQTMPEHDDYARQFFARYYRPSNTTIFVVGDFDEPAALGLIATHYGPWSGALTEPQVPVEPPQKEERRAQLAWPVPTQPRLLVGYRLPGAEANLSHAALEELLSEYLLGPTSPVYKELVLDKQLVEELEVRNRPRRDEHLWGYEAVLKDQAAAPLVEAAVEAAIDRLRDGEIDAIRFYIVRQANHYGQLMRLETPQRIAGALASAAALTGDPRTFERLMASVAVLDEEALISFASEQLVPARRSVVILEPPR